MARKLIIFDWDGTVMDTVPKIVNTIRQVTTAHGLDPISDDVSKSIIGLSLEKAMATLFPEQQDNAADLALTYKRLYKEDTTPAVVFTGVEVLLAALKAEGYLLAVATGKSRVGLDNLLAQSGLSDYFSITKTADDAKSKPDPDMLQQILRELEVNPEQAIMIGDTAIDMQLANNANVPAVAVTFGAASAAQLEKYAPLAVCESYAQLQAFLLPEYVDAEFAQ
ncbi:HAD family hydrolase [Pseudoalteromonas rubra]|uniref:HAD family hydrolase n=1 Tax=Pseudoalteromonas rubra TaxID=43658 RepID=A0A5S3WIC8_9GAMM|nr:HAD-IIIA family hydrolase [Pseudoalteromonas rubra]TMP26977.1 HAD family hydrolase [Pseudoalteromonas rubra]TMP27695.1 HAD family hydrolase [Pseudoalteromonas rubra]